jgi:CBS domain-containing protein
MVWNLALKVIDVARSASPSYVLPDTSVGELRRLIRELRLRILPVVADEKTLKLIGVVKRSQLLLVSSRRTAVTAKELMEEPALTAEPAADAVDLAERMLELDEWYTPIVDAGRRLLAVVGLEDYIAWLLDHQPDKLEKPVANYMSRNPVSVSPTTPIYKVWQVMLSKRIAALPVTDERGRLVGVVAEYDLLAHGFTRPELEADNQPARRGPKVSEVMSTPPVALQADATLLEAARFIVSRDIGRVYVVDEDGRLIGVVDRSDIIRAWLHPHRQA